MRELLEGEENADYILENYGDDVFFHEQMIENYFSDQVENQFRCSLNNLKAKYIMSHNPLI